MRKLLFLATTILAAALSSAAANAAQKEVTVWSWFVQSTMEKSIAAFEKPIPTSRSTTPITATRPNTSPR